PSPWPSPRGRGKSDSELRARWQAFAVALHLNRQRTDFVAPGNGLLQWFSFQQCANDPDSKAIASAHGVDHVLDFNGSDRALLTTGGFKPCAIGTGFQHHG